MPEELTIEQKIKIIEDTAISLEIARKSGKLEETVRELIPEKILKVARLIDEVPQDKIANCIDILMSASKMAFKMTIEYYTELCSLILKGEGIKELRLLSYISVLKLYTDIVNPRAYLEDYTVRERSFIISKVDQVLNARFAEATKDIDTLERATQNGTLEEEALKFSTEEIQNLLEIVTHMVSRTDDHRQKYLAILEASKVKRPKETATMITLKQKK